jgi:hypothetical protein
VTVSDDTIRMIAQAAVQRAITVGTGLTGYDLEQNSKALIPVMTPLRNKLKRIGLGKLVKGAPTHEWKAITSFDTGRVTGVSTEGGAPTRVTYSAVDMKNVFKTITLANDVTFDAEWMGVSLEGSSVAKRRAELLWQLMIVEERALLTYSQNLMVPAAPVLATATTGGAVAAATNWFQVTAVNANGETTPCTIGKIVTTGSTSTITLTVFTVPNATYYNVYCGTGGTQPANAAMYIVPSLSGAGNAPQPGYSASVALASGGTITSGEAIAPTITLTLTVAVPTSGANPPTTNTAISSKDSGNGATQMYDGFISQALLNTAGLAGAGSYVGQPAAATGVLALSDIDNALVSMFQSAGADPTTMYVGGIISKRITAQLIAANIVRENVAGDGNALANLPVGQRAIQYINPMTGRLIDVVLDRYMPLDTILFMSHDLPFPIPNLDTGCAVLTNREYWSVDFAVTQSQYSFANYVNETPVAYYLGGTGVIRGCVPSY